MSGRRWRVATWGVAASLAGPSVMSAGAGAAGTTVVACGQRITTDVVLGADVGPCPGSGLLVHETNNLTIDLNGHRVIGPADLTHSFGIRLTFSEGVTIKNGTVTGFGYGVAVDISPRTTVTGMALVDNRGGLIADGRTHTGWGIRLQGSSDSVIAGNRIIGNGPGAGVGVSLSGGVLIERNLVQGNDVRQLTSDARPGVVLQQTVGIQIVGGLCPCRPPFERRDGHTVRYNQVLDNGWHGIEVQGGTSGNVVMGNVVARNGLDQPVDPRVVPFGDGISMTAPGNVVEGNAVWGNGANGIQVVHKGSRISRNTVWGNVRRPTPFASFDLHDTNFACAGNTWSGNVAQTFSHPCVLA